LSSALLLVPGDGEDGRLEVRELLGLDLHARLVVLSACETGLGKLSRGDELVGLQRAFLYAGTPTVVTTLWKVDDRASYELIRSFYEHLKKTGAADALRQAQLETMRTAPGVGRTRTRRHCRRVTWPGGAPRGFRTSATRHRCTSTRPAPRAFECHAASSAARRMISSDSASSFSGFRMIT
jgi:CHAT domain-containing protein